MNGKFEFLISLVFLVIFLGSNQRTDFDLSALSSCGAVKVKLHWFSFSISRF